MVLKYSPAYFLFLAVVAMTASGCARNGDTDSGGSSTAGTAPTNSSQAPVDYGIPSARERFEIHRALIADKLQNSLLPAMREHDIDMWIVLDRENNYDPVHEEIGGGYSGVRAAFIFYDDGGDTLEKIYYGSHAQPLNSVINQVYDERIYYGYSADGLTTHVRKAVYDRDPQRIGVNTSPTLPEADGLTVGLKNFLVDAIGPEYADRIVSAELVVRDFRINRTELEAEQYTKLLNWSARWMEEALSTANVVTNETTAEDIAWFLEDRAHELGLVGHGTVRVVREGELLPIHDPDITIQPGDIVAIDGGMEYLGYGIDIKRTAYVLHPGETVMSENLLAAWRVVHDVREIYTSKMVPGAIGHEIKASIDAEVQEMGYHVAGPDSGGDAMTTNRPEAGIYGHSIGNDVHDIGTRIADDIPFAYGDRVRYPLVASEWVSIEFHVSVPIPEWGGKTWYARLEEAAQITENGVKWLLAPQEDLFFIEAAR